MKLTPKTLTDHLTESIIGFGLGVKSLAGRTSLFPARDSP